MNDSFQIYQALKQADPEQQEAILREIPEDHEAWAFFHCIGSPTRTFRYRFKLVDPQSYPESSSVAPGTFQKLLEHLYAGSLSESHMIAALTAVSQKCSETEWTQWWRPVLAHQLLLPVPVTLFNEFCPSYYHIIPEDLPKFTQFKAKKPEIPNKFLVEPYLGKERKFIRIYENSVLTMLEDGSVVDDPVGRMVFDLLKVVNLPRPFMVEGYQDADLFVVRDLNPEAMILDNGVAYDLAKRRGILEEIFSKVRSNEVILVETFSKDEITDGGGFGLFLEQGYSGMVIRDLQRPYLPSAGLLVNPDKRATLTCTGVEKNGSLIYLTATGRTQKREYTTLVQHGLTSKQKLQLYSQRDLYVGRQLTVRSCGISPDGKLMFPVFNEWKESKNE